MRQNVNDDHLGGCMVNTHGDKFGDANECECDEWGIMMKQGCCAEQDIVSVEDIAHGAPEIPVTRCLLRSQHDTIR